MKTVHIVIQKRIQGFKGRGIIEAISAFDVVGDEKFRFVDTKSDIRWI